MNLISLRDGIDLHTAAGRLMANVLASVAQYETEVRAERVRAGQQAARKRGFTWGGSKPGWSAAVHLFAVMLRYSHAGFVSVLGDVATLNVGP